MRYRVTSDSKKKKLKKFRLRQVSFSGSGLQAELDNKDWEQIRKLAYEGHGG